MRRLEAGTQRGRQEEREGERKVGREQRVSLEERSGECDLIHTPYVGLGTVDGPLGCLGMSQEVDSLNYRSSGLSGALLSGAPLSGALRALRGSPAAQELL